MPDTAREPRRFRSGFCNPSWPLDVQWGRDSHGRCRKADCPCDCGLGIHTPAVPPTVPQVPVGSFVAASGITAATGPYSWWQVDGRLTLRRDPAPPVELSVGPIAVTPNRSVPVGSALIGPADMEYGELVTLARAGDPRVAVIQGVTP